MRYRNAEKSIPEIALELGVDAVVEGSVLRDGNTVVITSYSIHYTKLYEGAIGILKVKFIPEPSAWGMLSAGFGLLGILYRIRRRE